MRADRNLAVSSNLQGHATTGRRISGLTTAVAPPALVQHLVVLNGTAPVSGTMPSPVTAGNTMILGTTCFGNQSVVASDSQGNTYTKEAELQTANIGTTAQYWARLSASGSLTVTATPAGGNASILAMEWSGLAASPVDQAQTLDRSSTVQFVVMPNFSGLVGSSDLVTYWTLPQTADQTATGGIWTDILPQEINGIWELYFTYAVTGPNVTGPQITAPNQVSYQTSAVAYHP